MKSATWVDVGLKAPPIPFLKSYLEHKGHSCEVPFFQVNSGELVDQLELLKAKYSTIRLLDEPLMEEVLKLDMPMASNILGLGAADALLKGKSHWALYSFLSSAFDQCIQALANRIQLNQSIILVGVGAHAYVASKTLIKMGFRNFKIAHYDEDKVAQFIGSLKLVYFGVVFEALPVEQLILLRGESEFLVNTLSFDSDKDDLLVDLCYFNFLRHQGVVINFGSSPKDSLILEADRIGSPFISNVDIFCKRDQLWAEEVLDIEVDYENYKKWAIGKRKQDDSLAVESAIVDGDNP